MHSSVLCWLIACKMIVARSHDMKASWLINQLECIMFSVCCDMVSMSTVEPVCVSNVVML